MPKKKTKKKKKIKQPKDLLDALKDEEPDDPILNEIEAMFNRIKDSGILTSEFEEQREVITSNLIIAYHLNKLEKELNHLNSLLSKKGKR